MEAVARGIAGFLGRFQNGALMQSWAQHAETIARAAVSAGLQAVEGKREPGVWALQQADIVRLGWEAWKDPSSGEVERGTA
ncbi:Protein fmp52, mitochondrial [Aspergillus melleus]|uniref:Protein fmp52, mitochondrial n=1 Tax=Aspergillus melleus TaxID=138277 RepID=UPI001E8E177C|nr:Protein fmp52, mitochondrial [Aspergillus melleus]KAH8422879.1 Protein fmp52, mitochondrial [Aspergillus melleus]